jgi:translation elongation factor P/translation initiation factor 5A
MKSVCQGLRSTLEMGTRFKVKGYSENTLRIKDCSLNKDNRSGLKNKLKLETVNSGLKYSQKMGTVIQN